LIFSIKLKTGFIFGWIDFPLINSSWPFTLPSILAKIFQKQFTHPPPLLLFRPLILTIGIKSKVLESHSCFDPKPFLKAKKLPFGEGASINRSPLFCGLNYQLWKVRMKIFGESIDIGIWDAIVNGPFVPKIEKDDVFIEKPWYQWTESETKKAQYDCIAKSIISSPLNSNEFFRVSKCAFAKEMWDILEVIHEATIDVKNNNDKNQPSNRYNNIFFGCGKHGHIKVEYPSNVSKEKGGYKC